MSTKVKVLIGVVVLALVGGVASYFVIGARGAGVEIESRTARTTDLTLTVIGSGRIESGVSADVFPPTSGTLARILVSDGETVTAGMPIAELDTDAIEAQLAQAEAGLAQARAALANAGAQGGGAKAMVAAQAQLTAAKQSYDAALAGRASAESAWKSAEAAHALANPADVATYTALGLAEQQAYAGFLNAKAGVAQASAAIAGADAALAQAKSADPEAQKDAAEAAVAQAEAAVALLEAQLDSAVMVAPIDGVVIFNSATSAFSAPGAGSGVPAEGSMVSPQAAPFTVVDLSALKFVAEVDESEIQRVRIGMTAEVLLDSFPGTSFATKVARVVPVARTTTTGGTVFAVEMPITEPEVSILLGMKGEATIEAESREAALTIPVEALFSEGGDDFVYVIEEGKLVKTSVTIGAETSTEIEVIDGLSNGDELALAGVMSFKDGMAVRVKR